MRTLPVFYLPSEIWTFITCHSLPCRGSGCCWRRQFMWVDIFPTKHQARKSWVKLWRKTLQSTPARSFQVCLQKHNSDRKLQPNWKRITIITQSLNWQHKSPLSELELGNNPICLPTDLSSEPICLWSPGCCTTTNCVYFWRWSSYTGQTYIINKQTGTWNR